MPIRFLCSGFVDPLQIVWPSLQMVVSEEGFECKIKDQARKVELLA